MRVPAKVAWRHDRYPIPPRELENGAKFMHKGISKFSVTKRVIRDW